MTSTYRQMVNAGLLAAMALLGFGCSDSKPDASSDAGTGTGGSGSGGSGATGGGSDGSGGSSTVPGTCVTDGKLVITDDTNYTIKSTLTIDSITVKDNTDLTFDWSALTKDFFGRPINAAEDIDLILVSLWGMTGPELAENLNKDNLPLSDNKGGLTSYPGETENFTSVKLTQLNSFHNEVPPDLLWSRFDTATENYQYPQDKNVFMLSAIHGTDPKQDARMLRFFNLDPASTNTTIALTDDSTKMTLEVHLANIKQFLVPATQALSIDWSQMKKNALGNEYDVTQITEAVVAHYASLTLQDLEEKFVYLQETSDGWWSGEVESGTSIDLSTLKDKNESAFSGIDSTGVWLVALFCSPDTCANPAPWSITVIKPCE